MGSQDYNFFQLHLETGKAAVVLRVAKRLDGWKVMTLHSHRLGYTQKAFTRMFLFRANRIASDVFSLTKSRSRYLGHFVLDFSG